MNLNPLAFQYLLRGNRLAELSGQMLAAAHEQRDRELEDYLGNVTPGGLTQAQADLRYVKKTGDTMTGQLVVNAAPGVDVEGALYVKNDATFAGGISQGNGQTANLYDLYVGDICRLALDPVNPLDAVTKRYVDGLAATATEVFVAASDPIGANPQAKLWYSTATTLLYGRAGGLWVPLAAAILGAGLNASQSIATGNTGITFTAKAYDIGSIATVPGTGLTVPSTGLGTWSASLLMTTTPAVNGNSLVRLIINGSSIWLNTIPTGQSIGTVNWTGRAGAGTVFTASFWNGGTTTVTVGTALEINRIASTQ